MNTQTLIHELAQPDAARRLTAARIVGIVDEVDALPTLTRAYKTETDAHVLSTMHWAGKRLKAAQTQGYSTFGAIWEHFQIQRELDNTGSISRPRPPGDERLHGGLDGHHLEMLQRQVKLEEKRDRLSGGLIGMLHHGDRKKMDAFASSSAGEDLKAGRRIAPAAPTEIDIRPHVQRLLRSPDEAARRKAAITLADVNNPAALPALAQAFVTDPSPAVMEAAQQSARLLYWNLVYYEMEQDGTITRELQRRRQMMTSTTLPTDTSAQVDAERQKIEDLLRRGRERRSGEKRRRKD